MARPYCAYCRTTLSLGNDVIAIQHGVLGPHGFIPLEEHVLLCGEACLVHYGEPSEEGPRRLP